VVAVKALIALREIGAKPERASERRSISREEKARGGRGRG